MASNGKSYKGGFKIAGETEFSFSALRFGTFDEAKNYMFDLETRWGIIIATTVEQSNDPVNYAWIDGHPKRIRD